MIDLTRVTDGELGPGSWFSDLLFAALQSGFTGGILVKHERGDSCAFFRGGQLVHCGGSGFQTAFLGALLSERGLVSEETVAAQVEVQRRAAENRPLLGALLVSAAALDPAEVKRAIQAQNEARAAWMAGLGEGRWQAATGENARIRDVGVLTETWPTFHRILERHLGERELRSLADSLLGKAVMLTRPTTALPGLDVLPPETGELLRYLEKPRKPDQLERALQDRRRVRGLLRGLEIVGLLEVVPVAKAIPIPKATLLKGQEFQPPAEPVAPTVAETPPITSRVSMDLPVSRPDATRVSLAEQQLIRETRELHAALTVRNHFDFLGAKEDTPPAELRHLYTALAKKFHPDTFPPGAPREVQAMAKEISARINEAYQTLTQEKSRAEYIALLRDSRFKGDARKAERAKEAEVKAKMGHVMLKKKDLGKAREYFRIAMEFDPENGEHKAAYAWTIFADSSFDRQEGPKRAHALLSEALKLADESPQIHFWLAQVLKSMDRQKEALHYLRTAHRLDPKNVETERELRLLESRIKREKEEPGKSSRLSSLGKLFRRD